MRRATLILCGVVILLLCGAVITATITDDDTPKRKMERVINVAQIGEYLRTIDTLKRAKHILAAEMLAHDITKRFSCDEIRDWNDWICSDAEFSALKLKKYFIHCEEEINGDVRY